MTKECVVILGAANQENLNWIAWDDEVLGGRGGGMIERTERLSLPKMLGGSNLRPADYFGSTERIRKLFISSD